MIIPSCNDRHTVELSEKPPLRTDVGNSVGVLGLGGDLGGEEGGSLGHASANGARSLGLTSVGPAI